MKRNKTFMRIGITGGVGAGKSVVLNHLKENYACEILIADDIGNEVKMPGGRCYEAFIRLVGEEIVKEDGTIDRAKAAEKIFADDALLEKVNALIHPAVKDEVRERIAKAKAEGRVKFVFVEAALLIEAGYVPELDELWYVCAGEQIRAARLKEARGYTQSRIEGIMEQQLSDEDFKRYADRVIVNNGTKEELLEQIDEIMGEYTWQEQ